ncbi:MAG: UDP-N-acetylglucosamine 2-epimerase (non-hydrolyzing), partial [Gemmatimonadetes bacterium]|nr:UDP-N-acetylglucosamine 2-epimerase (non-hydrolyzing) [Gemmatimonadota bacterium]
EATCLAERPDLVLVYGDVNSTVAAALVATKLRIPVGHVEAGLRSRDRSMPEEINRVVTDTLADLLFTPSPDAHRNLLAEGVAEERIHFVGNVMIDSLVHALPLAREVDTLDRMELDAGKYVVVTLHRPPNVDDPEQFANVLAALDEVAKERPVVFPMHPRTRARLAELGAAGNTSAEVRAIEPVGYLDMLNLVSSAELVITDSGGLQEETSYLGVPCITLRPNTERPITCMEGTNQLVPPGDGDLLEAVKEAGGRRMPGGAKIDRWDGRSAERIADVVCNL